MNGARTVIKWTFASLFLLCASVTLVRAQQADTPVSLTNLQKTGNALAKSSAVSGGPISGVAPGMTIALPSAQLSFTNNNGEVAGAYNLPLTFLNKEFSSVISYAGFKIEVPTSQKSSAGSSGAPAGSGITNLASSSQLPNGLKVSFPFIAYFVPITDVEASYDASATDYASQQCFRDNAAVIIKNLNAETLPAIAPPNLKKAQAEAEAINKPTNLVQVLCASTQPGLLDGEYLTAAYPPPSSAYFWPGSYFRPAITPSVQYVTDSFYEGAKLTQKDTKHVLPSIDISLGVGISFKNSVTSSVPLAWMIATPDFNYGATYKDQTSKIECVNKATATLLTCVNGPIGSPKIGKTETASLALKLDFPFNEALLGTNTTDIVAIPKYSYDAAIGGTSLDLPLYFVLKSSDSVYPGIDMTWNNLKHQFMVGAFIATSLGS